jgi:hypothetical protein
MNREINDRADEFSGVTDELVRRRPALTPLDLDRVKLRAMRGGRPTSPLRRKGIYAMRSRLTIALSVLFVAVGTGGALAVTSSPATSPSASSSQAQYLPPCPPNYNYTGKTCVPSKGHSWFWKLAWGWVWNAFSKIYNWVLGWCWVFV